jgi:predicted O-methyltransferase YrrM
MAHWKTPSKPFDVQPIPWLGRNVIDRLSQIITKEFNVIEHGAGGSTLWFADKARFVLSVENKPEWYDEILSRVPPHVTLILNKSTQVPDEWMEFPSFDLLLIDGEPVEERSLWIIESRMIIKSGGYVVLDNANRPEYKTEREYLHSISQSVETFDNNDGSKYLVTDICRLP